MRFLPKGGIWKNTEDEILKASVMKYGLNQWSRISSLLTRKSAKQCKARWYEWLDPAIKKTEWSKEEEEKLLHLAKIMPTQWRTIAPIIGRTASQCLDHYERLISQHEADKDPSEADPKRLRPGEIDPAPETRPARPDPVDMDEDELEMLQEARARLANTKGKKAKRKARERMLRDARIMAAIQKKNELKVAGINMTMRRPRKDKAVDYSAEIPFHIPQPAGFYDTTEEDKRASEIKNSHDFKRLTSEKFEGNPEKKEALERKKDIRRQRLYKEAFLPDAVERINELNNPKEISSKRPELNLPAPQVSQTELEYISKLYPENSANVASKGPSMLMETQNSSETPTPARTPLTGDFRRKDIEDNIALREAKNPLLGGESVKLHDPNFDKKGITLQKVKTFTPVTPNVLLSSALHRSGLTPVQSTPATPYSNIPGTPFLTPLHQSIASSKTPMRDSLSLNLGTPSKHHQSEVLNSAKDSTDLHRSSKKAEKRRLKKLKKRLGALPDPKLKQTLEIILPIAPSKIGRNLKDEGAFSSKQSLGLEKDKDDEVFEEEREGKKMLESMRQRRSTARKRGLPLAKEFGNIPVNIGDNYGFSLKIPGRKRPLLERKSIVGGRFKEKYSAALKLLENEYEKVLEEECKGDVNENELVPVFPESLQKYREKSKNLLDAEMANLKRNHLGKNPNSESAKKITVEIVKNLNEANEDVFFIPSKRAFGLISGASKTDSEEAARQEAFLLLERWSASKKALERVERRTTVVLKGLQMRAEKASAELASKLGVLASKRTKLETFRLIQKRENLSAPMRMDALKERVAREIEREKNLQKRYKRLFAKYKLNEN